MQTARTTRPDARWVVAAIALAAFLLRLPGLTGPPGADESGFLIVARTWDPQPDSLFGPYFVDRPPLLLLVIRLADAVGGLTAVRLLGALSCAVLVLTAAACARLIAGRRAPAWVAVCVAAATSTPLIDPVHVKGELLGIPFVMAGCWLALLALRRESAGLALLAGALASLAVGLKQNLLGALVFAAVLLVGSVLSGRISGRVFTRLALAGLLGAALHPAVTVAWAQWAGVDLATLWHTVVSFRAEASEVLSSRPSKSAEIRAWALLAVGVLTGIFAVLACFLALLPVQWRINAPLTAAIAAMCAYDVLAVVVSGSYWLDYLFALIPVTALAASALIGSLDPGSAVIPAAVGAVVLSCTVGMVAWLVFSPAWISSIHADDTGRAIGEVSQPGDTLVVYGGQADIQLTSGLSSPYTHLWSLPMRTLDPDLDELTELVEGPDAPTWLVEAAYFGAWNQEAGARLRAAVREKYDDVVPECGDAQRIWRLKSADRATPQPAC
ncbi:hypothetical protein [Nocardioides campestrisoli]|uniref:hypothetical protein n=1 Tax=Nocardioides campestrisoli TaxID=2736757 RepID=UPI0015E7D036|nr:hypothetical protein [Nocardioides campestrisoli]